MLITSRRMKWSFSDAVDQVTQQRTYLSSYSGTEPEAIHEVMEALDPFILGQTLTGAGGGGFLVLLTKEPNMGDKVKALIQAMKVFQTVEQFGSPLTIN